MPNDPETPICATCEKRPPMPQSTRCETCYKVESRLRSYLTSERGRERAAKLMSLPVSITEAYKRGMVRAAEIARSESEPIARRIEAAAKEPMRC